LAVHVEAFDAPLRLGIACGAKVASMPLRAAAPARMRTMPKSGKRPLQQAEPAASCDSSRGRVGRRAPLAFPHSRSARAVPTTRSAGKTVPGPTGDRSQAEHIIYTSVSDFAHPTCTPPAHRPITGTPA
jgi:hypothetical protein